MRLAIQTPIACCTSCLRSYNYDEFSRLEPVADAPRKTDGMPIARRQCEACDHFVSVAGFHLMDGAAMWQSWEQWQAARPDSMRRPVMLPENNRDRLWLWWARLDFLSMTGLRLVLFLMFAVLLVVALLRGWR